MEQPNARPGMFRKSRIKLFNSSLEILLNPNISVIPYSIPAPDLSKDHLETSSTSVIVFQVKPNDLKYSKCSSGISYFGLPVPL